MSYLTSLVRFWMRSRGKPSRPSIFRSGIYLEQLEDRCLPNATAMLAVLQAHCQQIEHQRELEHKHAMQIDWGHILADRQAHQEDHQADRRQDRQADRQLDLQEDRQ